MRKDVKLGLAIGGILLAVLIVYMVAVSGSSKKQVARGDGQSGVAPDGTVTLESDEPGTAGASATPPVPPPAPAAQYTPPGGRDPFAADKPGEVAQGSSSSSSPRKSDDWNKILNDQLVLMTETPQPVNGSSRTAAPAAPGSAEPSAPIAPAQTSSAGSTVASEVLPPPAPPTVRPIDATSPPIDGNSTGNATVVGTIAPPSAGAGSITATGGRIHVVQAGETLSSISMAAYGNPNFYPHIQRANPAVNPNRLKLGMKITLPDVAAVKPSAAAAPQGVTASATIAATIDPSKQYRVQPGDSLHKIAQALYGDSTNADRIYQLNKPSIGEDPHRLKVGQVLELPAPPTAPSSR